MTTGSITSNTINTYSGDGDSIMYQGIFLNGIGYYVGASTYLNIDTLELTFNQ